MQNSERKFYLHDVESVVCKAFAVSGEALRGGNRERPVAWARMAAFHLSRAYTERSLPQIGAHYGKDHTTVLHGVRRIPELVTQYPEFAAKVQSAATMLDCADFQTYAAKVRRKTLKLVAVELAATWV